MRTPLRLLFLLVCLLAARGLTAQQPPPLDAALTALTQTNVIRAGATARLAMRVVLDKSLHVQSNTPSDPGFIATVLTVEGLADDPRLARLQDNFVRCGAAQCGICTPGFLMTAAELCQRGQTLNRAEVRDAVAGNLSLIHI